MTENVPQKTVRETAGDFDIPKTPLRFVLFLSSKYKGIAIGAVIAVVVAQLAELAAVFAISELVDTFNAATSSDAQMNVLVLWGAVFVALGVLDRVAWRTSGFLGVAWAIKADAAAYRYLYGYVVQHSHGYFINRFAGSISNKISNAAGNSADMIMRIIWDVIPEVLSLVVTIWLLATIHWSLGLTMFVVLALVFVFNMAWVKKRRPLVIAYSEASSNFRGKGVDLITNIGAARQYARAKAELSRLDIAINDRQTKDFRQSYHGEWLMVWNGVFGVLLMIIILLGVYEMLRQDVATAGELVLVLVLLARVGYTFNVMGQMMNSFVRRYGEIEEGLQEVLVPLEITDAESAAELTVEEGDITWKDVTFTFGENAVFKDFNLNITSGQRVGLVGSSGAGKTTFISLLLRQHDIDSGEILIDQQNIAQVTQDSLRSNIAVVPQEPMLFHRSVRENIAYGKPDATEDEIVEVARKAQAHDFISGLPEGYETLVGERGVKLSGGQKQRVAIARAMLKDAPILVLDEATSALDSESEVAIQKALHELMAGKTVIAIAHRLSTLREMDRIIVLETGKIVEDGTHSSLATAGGTYERLWSHQAGGFLVE